MTVLAKSILTSGILFVLLTGLSSASTYSVSKAVGLGRRFDGVGGLSGGGCSTRLLADYNRTEYGQIMDYLFLPNFAASLHILKVEIGGDVQSTDGTEPSHMHTADDENYERGYEWQVMVEAKRRNPNLILYGLSWGFPGWVGEGGRVPWTNSTVLYTLKWILGAKKYYNLEIDYIGIWNERSWNKQYTLALKAALTGAGLKTKIVAHDAYWDVCNDLERDPEWASAIDVIGAHYPAAKIPSNCAALNKVQWASEDMAVSWDTGASCWARELNQNYVRANLTATIAWDLLNSFYDNLAYAGAGLLRAVQPWSGFYQVGQVIWAAAHWTQFTQPGWFFLQHGSGVGLLEHGGSYVTLTDATGQQLTMIVETMQRNNSQCRFSTSDEYNTADQTATFHLDETFAHVTQLFVFYSNFTTTDVNQAFVFKGVLSLDASRSFTLQLPVGVFYTLSTINGTRGNYTTQSVSTPFPLPYADDFESYALSSEAAYFADQSGSWEIVNTSSSRGKVMRQMVTEKPISWCTETPYPYSVIGDPSWQKSFNVSVDVLIERSGIAFVAVGVSRGGCYAGEQPGPATIFSVNTTDGGTWQLSGNTTLSNPLSSGSIPIAAGTWYTITLRVLSDHSEAFVSGQLVGRCELKSTSSTGWVAIGSSWDHVQFDRFQLQSTE